MIRRSRHLDAELRRRGLCKSRGNRVALTKPRQTTEQLRDRPGARYPHDRHEPLHSRVYHRRLDSEQLAKELIRGQGLLADLLEIGSVEVPEVARDDDLDVPGDGRREHVAIFLVVRHLVLDRVGRGLIEHRAGKGRQHRRSQTLPLLRLKDTVPDQVPASLIEYALGPERIQTPLGRDPQQEVANQLLIENRGVKNTPTPMRLRGVSEPSRRRTHS